MNEPEDERGWAVRALAEHLPNETLPPPEAGRLFTELLDAVAALRGRGRARRVFDRTLTQDERRALSQALADPLQAAIDAWLRLFESAYGEDGRAYAEAAARMRGLDLPSLGAPAASLVEPADPKLARLLEDIRGRLEQPERLRSEWTRRGFPIGRADSLACAIGAPDSRSLAALSSDFERIYHGSLPADLTVLYERLNGISVAPRRGRPRPLAVVPAESLREPQIWPALVVGDHFELSDLHLLQDASLFAFGGRIGAGWWCLAVPERRALGDQALPVYWVDHELSKVAPARRYGSLRELLSAWSEDAFSW
jgi:hypothetical protein